MSLELINISGKTRIVPKYRYNGKVTLKPKETFPIEDYMTSFFTPYSRIGVVIRKATESNDLEDIKKSMENGNSKEIKKAEEINELKEDKKEENKDAKNDENTEKKEENKDEKKEEVKEDKKEDTGVKYKAGDLLSMSIGKLRNIAESLGIDTVDMKRKSQISDAIIAKQNEGK